MAIVGVLAGLVLGSLATAMPASASSGIAVFVGYADSLRADVASFPTPWAGSPNTVFRGCAPASACVYDAGAVRIVNNTGSTVTVNAVAVHIDTCTFSGWAAATLAPGANLIVTQMDSGAAAGCTPGEMDTSDIGPGGKLLCRHLHAQRTGADGRRDDQWADSELQRFGPGAQHRRVRCRDLRRQ